MERWISSEAYQLLAIQTSALGNNLFPNLRSFYWPLWEDSWDFVPFLRLFIHPGLADVSIVLPDEDSNIYRLAIVSSIPTKNLTDLQLEHLGNQDSVLDALGDLLDSAAETLRSVDLRGEVPMAIIDKLLRLRNLHLLKVYMPSARISPPDVVFPSLEKLTVRCGEPESWLHVLKNIPNPALRELDISILNLSPTDLRTLGHSLLDVNIKQSLISFTCSLEIAIPLTGAGLRPFLSCEKLTTLNISAPCTAEQCGFRLEDSIICRLAKALPRLKYLALGSIPCSAQTSNVTITSLVALSAYCVDLDFLQLHFSVNDILSRDIRTSSQTQESTCQLRTLSPGSRPLPSDQKDILLVTFAILRIFPHLEEISKPGGNWKQVEQIVELFRMAPRIVPPPTSS